MEVTSDDPSINQPSSLTFRVQVQNPLRTDSNIEFTIPADFGVAGVDTVQTRGSNMYTDISSKFIWDPATRTILINQFNKVPLGQREFIYFVVSTVVNPGQTNPTASFTYKIYDPDNN